MMDYKEKYLEERKNALKRVNALRAGEEMPSKERLQHAKIMADHYNMMKVGKNGFSAKMNDNATLALAQQLEAMATEVLLEPTEPLMAASLLPDAPDVQPGHTSYAYATGTEEGVSKIIANHADDLPTVGLDRNKVTQDIYTIGNKFYYSIMDVETAVFTSADLPSDGARASRRSYARKLDDLLAFGAANTTVTTGLANQATGSADDQVRHTAATSAAWSSPSSSSDADTMYTDLSKLVAQYERDNLGNFQATNLLLPPQAMANVRQVRVSDSGRTVLESFQAANPGITVSSWSKLGDVDDGGSNNARGLLMSNSPDVAQHINAQSFRILAPQPTNLSFCLPAFGRSGGAAIRQRLGMRYLTLLPTE